MKCKALILSAAAGLCLLPITILAQHKVNDPGVDKSKSIEKEVLGLEEAGRLKVLRGDSNWDDLIAEGAYMIAFDGSIILYQKGLQFPAMTVKSFEMSEMIVRVYGEVAVVTGLAEVGSEVAEKKPFSFKMRFLNCGKRRGKVGR